MFPSGGNTTASLKNNLFRFQCSSQNRTRSFCLLPGGEEKFRRKENTVAASGGALGCHRLPHEPPPLAGGYRRV